jgi:hypothetical protein
MNKKFILLFLIHILFSSVGLFAQNIAGVNPLTGAANVVIPIGNYQRGSINFPINLVYSGSGVKPTDVEGTAGMSAELQVGGAVVRQLRGLPDDCQQDILDSTRTGWMYNTNQSIISGFTPANTGTPNCTYEANDFSFVNSHFSSTSDTEPDVFYVNAPGLSCQLVYDQTSGKFHSVGYRDLVISYTTATDHEISSFTIINDAGTKYVFNVPEQAYQYIIGTGTPGYFANTYHQYINGITFYDKWYLSTITDINGNSISLSYTAGPPRGSKDSIKITEPGNTSIITLYIIGQSVTPQQLSTVVLAADEDENIANQTLTFTWADPLLDGSGKTCISTITGRGRSINFGYSPVKYTEHTGGLYYRAFLRTIYDSGCGSPLNYSFAYAGETLSAGTYATQMPDSLSTKNDYWGYYTTFPTSGTLLPAVYASTPTSGYPKYLIKASSPNSSYKYTLTGDNRAVDTSVVYYGALTQITNVNNGTTNIAWQSNDYYDPSANTTVLGGGVRVKSITYYDAISTAHNIVSNYSYTNPATGYSSGKPITLPQFAFTSPYLGPDTGLTLWVNSTVLSAYDLSSEDHTIVYEYERQTMTGAGNTLTQFYVPATNWDTSATPDCSGCAADWAPTVDLVSRNPCSAYTPLTSATASYPFVPNPNYDFERGLPKKVTTYNDSNVETSETSYTYQRTANPSHIPAFKYETNNFTTVMGYNKYNVNYNTAELVSQQTSKVFDSSTAHAQANLDTVTYTYGTTYYKLLSQQAKNSDGNIVTQNYSYIKDYAAASDTNGYITALYQLQQLNVNWPVETYTTLQNHSGTYYTQATLTLFRPYIPGVATFYRPFRQLNWIQPSGLTSFSKFAVNITGDAQAISYDSNYFTAANFMDYDWTGVLQSSDDGNKHEGSRFYDHVTNKPVAVFTNARAGEVWFSDFDSDVTQLLNHYTDSGGLGTVTDRNGKSARSLTSAQYISYILTKNTLATNYIFSAWLNASATGTVTITFTPTTGSVQTTTIHITAPTSGWQYFETAKVNVSGMSGNITVKVTTSATISIDDILCYPENTEATTYAFDNVQFLKICETNTNGVSAYYKYDAWGRLLYAYDQDHNILKKNVYVTAQDAAAFGPLIISIYGGTLLNTNTPVTFTSVYPGGCTGLNAITYTWTFGDGSPSVQTRMAMAPAHLYTMPGTYIANLTINSAIYGPLKVNDTITITAGPKTNLTYATHTTGKGRIATAAFYNGLTLVASFTEAQLLAGTAQVLKGSYTMKITMVAGSDQYPDGGTGQGYTSILESGDNTTGSCQEYSATNTYSFAIDISSCNNLNISVSTLDQCPR